MAGEVKPRSVLLAEARDARHMILTGKAVSRFIDANGEQIEYSKSNLDKLDRYISDMEKAEAGPRYLARPLRFLF